MSINEILGYLILFVHNYLIHIIVLYILFFTKIFYLDMFFLLMYYFMCYFWYILNECPLRALEEYLTGDKSKREFDEKKYKVIYILGKRYVIFEAVTSLFPIFATMFFMSFFIKIIYLVGNKKYK